MVKEHMHSQGMYNQQKYVWYSAHHYNAFLKRFICLGNFKYKNTALLACHLADKLQELQRRFGPQKMIELCLNENATVEQKLEIQSYMMPSIID